MKLFLLSHGTVHVAKYRFIGALTCITVPACGAEPGGDRRVVEKDMADLSASYPLCSNCDWEKVSDVRFLPI